MKFSIITPSFNQGQFIQQTIDSVISQAGDFEIEYFVMDGGSTDNTVKILKATAQKLKNNPRIKFYWQSNKDKGQVDAINQGLAKSTGDIIAYINSDDYYLPDAFNTVAKYFSSHPKSLWLVGNCQVSDPKLAWTFWLKHLWPIQYFKFFHYILNAINQPSVFLKKAIVDKVGLFNPQYKYSFDHDYWLRSIEFQLPNRLFICLSQFRVQTNSISSLGYHTQLVEDRQIVAKYTNSNPVIHSIHLIFSIFIDFVYKIFK